MKRNKPIIGLTGGIGAGKSTVAEILASLGASVIDSDKLGHEQLADPEVVATLRAWWGDSILTPEGGVDRRKIGAIAFADPAELTRLEQLLYPRIESRRESLMATYDADSQVRAIVLDTPKLYEVGLDALCDAVIFIEADRAVRVQRVAQTRQWNEKELTKRENLQKPLDMKRAKADHVVVNQFGLEALRHQIEHVFSSVLGSFT